MRTIVDYRSDVDDNRRWLGFPFRSGDIVVSTRSKHGTTWVQYLCLALLHGPDLPAPLGVLSPWFDHRVERRDRVVAALDAQPHRRVIKTHTPLDGLPIDARATYVVVARDPLDAAVSLYHQGANIDRERVAQLTGAPVPRGTRPDLGPWLRGWIAHRVAPTLALDGCDGVLWHVQDAWNRRHEPNVVLVRYADLLSDLAGSIRTLAGRLGIAVDDATVAAIADAARFDRMREATAMLVPDVRGVMRDRSAFFRRGREGAASEVLGADEIAEFRAYAATRLTPDAFAWLHQGGVERP